MCIGSKSVALDISQDNTLNTSPSLARKLWGTARLQIELLRSGDPRASEVDVASDWKLRRQLMPANKTLN